MAEETNPLIELGQLVDRLTPDQAGKLIRAILAKAEPEIESVISKSLPSAIQQALERFGYTAQTAGLLHLLAARSNDSKEAALQKALTLYALALDAREKGNRLAIISPDDMIVHDVVGFEPEEMEVQQVSG